MRPSTLYEEKMQWNANEQNREAGARYYERLKALLLQQLKDGI